MKESNTLVILYLKLAVMQLHSIVTASGVNANEGTIVRAIAIGNCSTGTQSVIYIHFSHYTLHPVRAFQYNHLVNMRSCILDLMPCLKAL